MSTFLHAVDAPPDEVAAARSAGLRYVTDETPGFSRRRRGKGWEFRDAEGKTISDVDDRSRILKLAIPPAWTRVWICPHPRGHLQATGRDDRGRKQYRYHAGWRQVRDAHKFERLAAFGKALPKIRAQVLEDMNRSGLPREKVIATIVRLLDVTFIRVGNASYAKENGSYGLTTLRRKHVEVSGSVVRFSFTGKSGKEHEIEWRDRKAAAVVKRCNELPGHHLFQYVDDDGERRIVGSEDVNEYLKQSTSESFTAKDFRTWGGTVLAACSLSAREQTGDDRLTKRLAKEAIEEVAFHLGNTPAIARSSYIHPLVIDSFMDGSLHETLAIRQPRKPVAADAPRLRPDERAVLRFLERSRPATARRSA